MRLFGPRANVARASTSSGGRPSFLAAFAFRDYRFLWSSTVSMGTVAAMESLVIGWLVLSITNSPQMVGLVAACRYVGMSFGPFFGALADRFDRRRILIAMRFLYSLYAFTLAALYFTSVLQIWHIILLVLFASFLWSFNQTAFNAMTADTVKGQQIASAVSMMMVGISGFRMTGSLMGGYLYKAISPGGCFLIMGTIYLLSSMLVFPIHTTATRQAKAAESVWKSMVNGVRFIAHDRGIAGLMLFAAIANLFIFPMTIDTMPVFARNVLHLDSEGLGWIVSAEGFGALLGSLLVSALGRFRYKGWLATIIMVGWPLLIVGFSFSRSLPLSLAIIAVSGIGRGIAMPLIQVLSLAWSDQSYYGRVMGVRMSVILMEMMGSIVVGALAGPFGIATVMLFSALGGSAAAALTGFWAPELRRADRKT